MSEGGKSFVIAVDGPAASGKGTLARAIAARLGFSHLDTGLLYRAVALEVIQHGADPADHQIALDAARKLARKGFNPDDPQLRHEHVGNAAGLIASRADIRRTLLDYQRNFAAHPPDGSPGAVLDGRDIGTVVCPDADIKLFIDAGLEERTRRREQELQKKGDEVRMEQLLADMKERDERDRTRSVAPLTAADDASVIDSTNLGPGAVFDKAMTIIQPKLLEWREQTG